MDKRRLGDQLRAAVRFGKLKGRRAAATELEWSCGLKAMGGGVHLLRQRPRDLRLFMDGLLVSVLPP